MQIPSNFIDSPIALNDRYLDLSALSVYSGLSVSSLRHHIRKNNLPAYSIPGKNGLTGKILIRQTEYDKWLKHYRFKPDVNETTGDSQIDKLLSRLK